MRVDVGEQRLAGEERVELDLDLQDERLAERALAAAQHVELGALHVELQHVAADAVLIADAVERGRGDRANLLGGEQPAGDGEGAQELLVGRIDARSDRPVGDVEGHVVGDLAPQGVGEEARRVWERARLAAEPLALGLVRLERGHLDHRRERIPPRVDPVAGAHIHQAEAVAA